MTEPIKVTVDTFVRAETDRMFAALQAEAGGVDRISHSRVPTPIDRQTVIRMNRDTLYSFAIVDISEGASITLPDAGGRYQSLMLVNQDHHINAVIHEPGEHRLTTDVHETPWVCAALRILVDPGDPADVAAVNALQDQVVLRPGAGRPFRMPDYEGASFDETRAAVLGLARHLGTLERAFGRRDEVDPVRHLLATAAGWGGLPDAEARYVSVEPRLPVGSYRLTVRDVPVDAFWSISVYNADGFFEPNDLGSYSLNSITATRNPDGSVTVQFGGCDGEGAVDCLPITDGWNYIVRLDRPRPEILDGSWTFPSIEPG